MDVCLHKAAERIIYHSMALQCCHAVKMSRFDANTKVAPAVSCASMSGMQMAFVDDLERRGLKRRAQAVTYRFDAVLGHHLTAVVKLNAVLARAPM